MENVKVPSKGIIEKSGIKILGDLLPTYRCQNLIKIGFTEASFDGYVNFFKDGNVSKKRRIL